jgi:hypothetical protein
LLSTDLQLSSGCQSSGGASEPTSDLRRRSIFVAVPSNPASESHRPSVSGFTFGRPPTCVGDQLPALLSTDFRQTVGTDKVAGTVNGSARTLSVNGQIPLGQNVAAGASADAITVTVTY